MDTFTAKLLKTILDSQEVKAFVNEKSASTLTKATALIETERNERTGEISMLVQALGKTSASLEAMDTRVKAAEKALKALEDKDKKRVSIWNSLWGRG